MRAVSATAPARRLPLRARPVPAAVAIPVRLAGAGLLGATAGIHQYLWLSGYRGIDWIGPLFLIDVIAASAATLAVLLVPARWLPWACAAGALLELGTLGGLLLSLTVGFLGFFESWQAPLAVPSAVVEAVSGLLLGGFAAAALERSRHGQPRP